MIQIVVGIAAVSIILLVLWTIGKIYYGFNGCFSNDFWDNVGQGLLVLSISAICITVLIVTGYILYRFGNLIIHAI